MAYTRNIIDSWKQAGRFFFWRFTEHTRDFPGWHFMVDRAASASIAALLRSMAQSESACSRVVVVSLPTVEVLSVPNNRHSQCVAPERLRIESNPADARHWSLVEEGAVVHWQLGADSLRHAAEVFADPAKHFDSTMGQEPALWCWGLLAHTPIETSRKRRRGA
jgi:hypothetical protein